ncbi:MAG: AraC family transcriptional regulator [Sphingobacteriales bacterium]|nr:MAG: AraC family transcriptional regulator [Sphingobacteriales bacterium]
MLFDFSRYSALLLIFFVHGLVYAGLLLQRALRDGHRSDGWLAAFLLLCAAYIAPWMLGFAGWYDTQPYRDFLFYFPFQHLYALGPVVYFYTQSLLNPSFRFTKKAALHFLPAGLYLVYTGVIFITDRVLLGRYWFLASQSDPDFDLWYQLTGFGMMFYYAVRSLRYYRHFRRLMLQVTSYAEGLRFDWVRRFLLAFLSMITLRVLAYGLSLLGFDDYSDSWWYYLGFALVFYYMAIRGYGNLQEGPVAYRPLPSGQETLLLLPATGLDAPGTYIADDEPIANEAAPTEDPELQLWKDRLAVHMRDAAPYKDPELSLSTLARQLGLPAAQLSRVVNRGFACNFNDFINGYRVRAVQTAIEAGEHRRQTLLGIAYDCGFNSKATFNRAFLKGTGQSPRAFIKEGE